jgi:Prolyl oligopeptidase family
MVRRVLLAFATLLIFVPHAWAQAGFTLEQIMSAPFPEHLTASKTGGRVVWSLDREGRRNIWVAEGPGFQARQLTHYDVDDDRNVYFTQTVDLVARLRAENVETEQLIFPDEVHDFLPHHDWLAAYRATSDFFDRHFNGPWK